MRYLNEADIQRIGIDWKALADVIEAVAGAYKRGEYAQPIKPYLKFGSDKNRIIAMPAYISEPIRTAGLKWIASYPDNLLKGLPRANSITVLNDADTGVPSLLINGSLISTIRTTAVSAALLRKLLQQSKGDLEGDLEGVTARQGRDLEVAVIGLGPIGQMHIRMVASLFSDRVARIRVYDKRPVELHQLFDHELRTAVAIEVCETWQEAYEDADLVFTCTASSERYIDVPSKQGSILMHISLRDYKLEALDGISTYIVDSWDEVCRADTEIERLHVERGLRQEQTVTYSDVLCGAAEHQISSQGRILFTPMGLAVFDVAIAAWYGSQAEQRNIGVNLD
ncbi:2,3-diaminopropionate biosynthesis protein SbnB [Paenibacillus sp. 481]|uniref:2,3-diaminopropionate biosynthesis protein SbnB n=1 Tax=Paenibacillus sp. 481 TaxID=2835869 RepID=UPI001E3DAA96|nr:2,3-diaminopropionate biosynthesis protein SbnB [Paenibacillus sp. 481]UHA73686.1 2,3-diaminopropionate biosynthesis protein SbnB [Paenibacillus sp. 481]